MDREEKLVTAAEMKQLDDRTIVIHGIPSLVLMERAALAAVDALLSEGFDLTRTLCYCGPGNNGGDGLAVCRLLHLAGYDARAVFVGDPAKRSQETRQQWRICESYGVRITPFGDEATGVSGDFSAESIVGISGDHPAESAAPTTIVDAVFGIGGGRAPSGAFAEAIRKIGVARTQGGARVLALDIPSGVSADTGTAEGDAVAADVTVTFAYKKAGLTRPPGATLAGKILVADIGIYAEFFKPHRL